MPNKTIYLSDELFNECKSINASDTISKLLRDHFNAKKSKEALITEADKLKEAKDKLIEEADNNINKLETQIRETNYEEMRTAEAEEKKKHKLADKISSCISNVKELYNLEMTEEQVVNFFNSKYDEIDSYLRDEGLI